MGEQKINTDAERFWNRCYYAATVGDDKQAVQKHIENQGEEDLISAQISMVENYDSFEGWLKSNSQKKDNAKKK